MIDSAVESVTGLTTPLLLLLLLSRTCSMLVTRSWAYPDDYNLIGTFREGGITTRAGMMGIINSVTYYYHCLICDILSYQQ